jgi:DNA invertase Pin-like site-specific DNA recombinase
MLAKSAEYVVVDVFRDDGISAYASKGKLKDRPEWRRLAGQVGQGRFDVVMAVAPDRLARNVGTGDEFLGLCARHGVIVHTKSGGIVDPSNPMAKAMAGMQNVFAEMDVAVRTAKLMERLDDETNNGRALWGRRPYGYTSLRAGEIVPEERARIIAATTAVVKQDRSLYSIAKEWNEAGLETTTGRPWSYQTVRQLLTRQRNVGRFVRHGEVVPDVVPDWEPLFDTPKLVELFDSLVAKLNADKGTPSSREQRWLCSNIVFCGVCGSPMRSSVGGRADARTMYYRCSLKSRPGVDTRRHTSIRVEELDKAVRAAVVAAFILGPTNALPVEAGEDLTPVYVDRAEQEKALGALVEVQALTSMSPALIAKKANAIQARIRELDAQIRETKARSARAAMTSDLLAGLLAPGEIDLDKVAEAATALEEQFDGLTLEQRRHLVSALLEVRVHPGRKPGRVGIRHKVATSLNDESADLADALGAEPSSAE